MIALLLNSGVGSRMKEFTEALPKALVPIGGGHTILSWQLSLLARQKVSRTVITTGPFTHALQADVSRLAPPCAVDFVHNPRYLETNYIYTMWLAKDYLRGEDILLLHGDLVLEGDVLSALCTRKHSSMVVDTTLPLPKKDFKARLLGQRIDEIGVDIYGNDCVAAQPAYFFRAVDFAQWMAEIDSFCARGETSVYAENALNVRLRQFSLFPLDVHGLLCSEIDAPEDLAAISPKFINMVKLTKKEG